MTDTPNKFQANRMHRWIAEIPGIDSFLIKEIDRPRLDLIKRNGRIERRYDPMRVVMFDTIDPNGAAQVDVILRSMDGILGDVVIKQLDAAGDTIETWTHTGSRITRIDNNGQNSGLRYDSEDACTITLWIGYDDYRLETARGYTS